MLHGSLNNLLDLLVVNGVLLRELIDRAAVHDRVLVGHVHLGGCCCAEVASVVRGSCCRLREC